MKVQKRTFQKRSLMTLSSQWAREVVGAAYKKAQVGRRGQQSERGQGQGIS